jgi:L-asparaginase/Glu-tRNA(Gln) amidotransferase subunit D
MQRLTRFVACLWMVCGAAGAAETPAPPKIVVLGTGGTIAGSAAVSTDVHEYKPGQVAVQALIDALPGLREKAEVRSEQLFQLGSASLTSGHWLKLARAMAR